jgi:glycosyltransferase involved in cell wall biosynthesis
MRGPSVVIITFNEERNIGRCIASVKDLAGEVVVVDSGSADATRNIASEAGARVVVREWTNYSEQKNFANDLAQGAYILSLDADEVLTPELAASISEALATGATGAYRCNRLTNYCGTWVRHGGWYPDAKVRLFPKGMARWEGEHVHEVLRLDEGLPITQLNGDLLHYSIESIADHRERIARYSKLQARKLMAKGRRPGAMERYFSPAFRFVQGYLFRGGFLDGAAGFHIARLSAWAVHRKYAELDQLLQAQSADNAHHGKG